MNDSRLKDVSWLAMTRLVFNEDQVADLIGPDTRAVMREAERLGYCVPFDYVSHHPSQFGIHGLRVWRSLLWSDTRKALGSNHER